MPALTKETLLRHCQTLYDGLLLTSEDGVWEGKLVELFSALGISNANYGRVCNTLYELGCMEQVRRGSRGIRTQIVLHRRPELEDMDRPLGLGQGLTMPTPFDRLSQRVNVMEGRLEGIDLKKYIAATEARLRKLEGKS